MPASSSSSSATKPAFGLGVAGKPKTWVSEHDAFIRRHAQNGEDATSIVILLETEYPRLRATKGWVQKRMKELGLFPVRD